MSPRPSEPPSPPESDATTVAAGSHSAPGFGSYRLLEKLGEGGMGEVWLAEQTTPVHRRVALKVIKLGMDTRQVIARFEAERQALALMDHPNIAARGPVMARSGFTGGGLFAKIAPWYRWKPVDFFASSAPRN